MDSEATMFNDNDRQQKATFRKREKTLRKNTSELAALCDIPALTICFGPDKTVSTWPENKEEVRDIITRYRGVSLHKSSKYNLTLADHLEQNRMKYGRTMRRRLVGMSRADAVEATRSIDSALRVVRERIKFLTHSCQNNFENGQADIQRVPFAHSSQNNFGNCRVAEPTSVDIQRVPFVFSHQNNFGNYRVTEPTSNGIQRVPFVLSHQNNFENRRVTEPTSDDIQREITEVTLPSCRGSTKIIRLFGKDVMVNSR